MRKRTKIRFSVEQATQIILNRPSDPNMTDLGEVSEEEELHHTEALPFEINSVSDDEEEEVDESETDTEEQTNGTGYNIQGRTYPWRKKHPPTCPTGVNENSFSLVPDDVAQWTPLRYFKQFGDDEITDVLVKQTISYSTEN